MNNETTLHAIRCAFRFLINQHQCKVLTEESDGCGVFVTYTNRNAGLRVSYEEREGGLFVMIFPLADGIVPTYRHWFDFTDFLSAKGESSVEAKLAAGPSSGILDLQNLLTAYANAVQQHLGSYLAGDFSPTQEMQRIVDRRTVELKEPTPDSPP